MHSVTFRKIEKEKHFKKLKMELLLYKLSKKVFA